MPVICGNSFTPSERICLTKRSPPPRKVDEAMVRDRGAGLVTDGRQWGKAGHPKDDHLLHIYIIYNIWQIDYNHLQPIDYNRIQSINTIDGHLIRSPSKLWTTWTSHKRVATLATLHRKKMQRMKNNQNIYNYIMNINGTAPELLKNPLLAHGDCSIHGFPDRHELAGTCLRS